MNKIIITLLAIVVVIAAMVIAVFVYMPEEKNEDKVEVQDIAVKNNIENEVENITENTNNIGET